MAKYHAVVPKLPAQLSFRDTLATAQTRRSVALGMLVSATQIFSGSMAAVSYSTS